MKIGCFDFSDDGLEAEEVEVKLNQELEKRGVSAEDVISVFQPTSYAITRVVFKKK